MNKTKQNKDKKGYALVGLAVKQKNLLSALKTSMGNVTMACHSVGVGRTTYYFWMKENPLFKEQVDEIEEIVLDWAESKLYEQIEKGNIAANIFYLKCQGKDRGWTEKYEKKEPQTKPFILSDKDKKILRNQRDMLMEADYLFHETDNKKILERIEAFKEKRKDVYG